MLDLLSQAGVKVGEQIRHLLVGESANKRRHHTLPCQYDYPDLSIARRGTAGEGRVPEHGVKIGRNFLERQIIVFMTMRTANGVKMLPFCLLRSKRSR